MNQSKQLRTDDVPPACAGAGTGDVTAMIRDPQGRQNTVEVMMEDKGDNTYRCTYRPTQMGPHVVTVTFGGMGIPKSPFSVDVGPGELLLPFHFAVILSQPC